jgi:hypothetical protein
MELYKLNKTIKKEENLPVDYLNSKQKASFGEKVQVFLF